MNLKIVNLEHVDTLPGGVGQPDDRACVIDLSLSERHPITGVPQHPTVYIGTLAGAHDYVFAAKCHVPTKARVSIRQYAIVEAYEALLLGQRTIMEARGIMHVLGVNASELDEAIAARETAE